jgi:asparagine N-glycosylation enzyme membrane subunit Stt3
VSRAWARTLPERLGGKAVLVALLGVLVVALVLRVWAATHGYEFRHGSDADQYERLAARLYEDGTFGIPGSENPYDFAPGMPFFAAAVYWLTGGVSPETARVAVAIFGTLGVFVVFLLGRRLGGPWAGVAGAAIAAVYPPTLFYTSLFSSEPLAMVTVPAGLLAFVWAADEARPLWAWIVPGLLFGLTAYLRPEYLMLTALLALIALVVVARRRGPVRGVLAPLLMVAAFAVVIAPWTIDV